MLDDACDPRARVRLETRARPASMRSTTARRCLSCSLRHSAFWLDLDGDREKKKRRERENPPAGKKCEILKRGE